jgi:two-component system phosphate regulon sensor histidine kinase PhoR
MTTPRPSRRDLIRATAGLMLPVASVFFVLVVTDLLAPLPALIAGAVCALFVGILVWRHLRDLAIVSRLVDHEADHSTDRIPAIADDSLVRELDGALRRQRRELRRRDTEVRAQLAANDIVIDSLPDPMLTLDDRMRIVRSNEAASNVLGRIVVGNDLTASLRHPNVIDAVQTTLEEGTTEEVEFTLPGAIDRAFVARVRTLSGQPADGAAIVLTLHDLTALKRADQMRADFIANASHELRTPLSALIGFIETLRGPAAEDGAARERFLGIMQDQANRMARLISDLLSLSRIELSEHSRPKGEADLVEVVERAVDSLELKAAEREMSIKIDKRIETARVCGDEDLLEQVVQNLLDNAIKYGSAASVIDVRVGVAGSGPSPLNRLAPGESVCFVAVHNEGEGIRPDHLPRLTERFYRINPTRSRELGGTGLGLAIVKHIVNRHRGSLTIESAAGRGATFTVYLLAADTPAARKPGEEGGRVKALER